jgi:hypothetical protein
MNGCTDGGRTRTITKLVLVGLALFNSSASADECTDTGRQATMLGMLDSSCRKYRLTPVGRSRFNALVAKSIPLGGERCATLGKMSMVQKLATPRLEDLATADDEKAFTAELCDLIAKYMTE